MPLYEYQCKKCHSLTERIQKFSDPPLAICPHCGGELEQLISAPAVRFKGSGWYVTDYARKSSKSGESGNGSAPASSSKDKSESESKSGNESKSESSKSEGSSTTETAKSNSAPKKPAAKE